MVCQHQGVTIQSQIGDGLRKESDNSIIIQRYTVATSVIGTNLRIKEADNCGNFYFKYPKFYSDS